MHKVFVFLKSVFRPLDFVVAVVFVFVTTASFVFAFAGKSGTQYIKITSPFGEWVYTLSSNTKPQEIEIQGELGNSIISFDGSQAQFVSSPCKNKLCISHSPLTKGGHWSACLPNKVF
ncbi:MAG: NusG domain II-containing protein [Treponemataceae bacterium]|nr:MAG: NusG domain II-containing protein [Treponemataceae bacterium]